MNVRNLGIKSLRSKILLYVALPIALLLASATIYLSVRLYVDLTEVAHLRIDLAVLEAAERIDEDNLRSVTVAKTMAPKTMAQAQ